MVQIIFQELKRKAKEGRVWSLESHKLRFKSWLCLLKLSTVRAGYIIFLGLSFLICKIVARMATPHIYLGGLNKMVYMAVFCVVQILIFPISSLSKKKNNESYHLWKTSKIQGPALDTLPTKTHRILSESR